jgi:hypothetical protein
MLNGQRTYGNRAVQRYRQPTGAAPSVHVQRWPDLGGIGSLLIPDDFLSGKQNQQGGWDFGMRGSSASDGSMLDINGSVGPWGENNDADTRFGFKAEGAKAKGLYKHNSDWGSADVGAFSGSAEASVGSNGLTFGATGNIVEGSFTAGKFTPGNNSEESVRAGLSLGGGFSSRLHWGDTDKDGAREYGFGFDAGPVSFDYKSEDPGKLIGSALLGPAGWFVPSPFGAVSNEELPK